MIKTKMDYEVLNKLSQEELTTLMYYVFNVLKAQYDVDNYKAKLLGDYAAKEMYGDLMKLFEFPVEDLATHMEEFHKERVRQKEEEEKKDE